ncbi:nitronate monooxygenase, partial [Nonomuraea wenchangensis]
FLGCAETALSGPARARVLAAGETGTAYGRVFDVAQRLAWPPEYGGRALRNAFFDRWHGKEEELGENEAARAELTAARQDGDYDAAFVYAGQAVGLVRHERPAAEVVAGFAAVDELLSRFARP